MFNPYFSLVSNRERHVVASHIGECRQGNPSVAASAIPTDATAVVGDGCAVNPGQAVVNSPVTGSVVV